MLREQLVIACRAVLVFCALLGAAYPAGMTAVAHAVFPRQAEGSLIIRDGRTLGSTLIGQPFDDPKYFWSRPSATSPANNAAASSGSNLGPTNPACLDAVRTRIAALHTADPTNIVPIPVDLVTASASGLDPHISPAAARYQVRRVARARGMSEAPIQHLIHQHAQLRLFGLLGEPVVNVLEVNLALDALAQ